MNTKKEDVMSWSERVVEFFEAPVWVVIGVVLVPAILLAALLFAIYMMSRGHHYNYGIYRSIEILDDVIENLERRMKDNGKQENR